MNEIKVIRNNLENTLFSIDILLSTLKNDVDQNGPIIRTIETYLRPSITSVLNDNIIGSIKDIEKLIENI